MIKVFISGFKIAGVPERSKGQGLGVLYDIKLIISTKKPCDVGLRAFKSLPLHFILIKKEYEKMKILAFTGMPCSGKSVAVQIAKEKNFLVLRMGDEVWQETKNQGLKLNDKNVGFVANDMRDKHGKDIWAKRTYEKIKLELGEDVIVIDGLRNGEEVDFFKKNIGNDFVIIAILASDEIRKQRVIDRKRTDDSGDIKDLDLRDKRELSWGLGEVIENADIKIVNEGGIDEFEDKIKKILQTQCKTIN